MPEPPHNNKDMVTCQPCHAVVRGERPSLLWPAVAIVSLLGAGGMFIAFGGMGTFIFLMPQVTILLIGAGIVPRLFEKAFGTVQCPRCGRTLEV